METAAIVVFALAAVVGIFLAAQHFRNAALPMPATVAHGLFAATGLVLLVLAYFGGAAGLGLPLIVLVVAALGGFFLVSFHLRGRRAPSAVVIVHALVAVAGFVALLVAVL